MLPRMLLLPVFAVALGAAEDVKLPANIQGILDKAEKEVAKNRSLYDEANRKSLDAGEKALKAEMEKLTKAGKLDEAVALKKLLDGFRAEVLAKVDPEIAKKNAERAKTTGTEPEMLKMLVGKTYFMNGESKDALTFLANGIIDLPVQWSNRTGATWSWTDKFTVTIKANPDTYVMKFAEDYRSYVSMRNSLTSETGTLSE